MTRRAHLLVARGLPQLAALTVAVSVSASEVRAQDLFELEVFRYESAPAGGYNLEFHTNAMSKGTIAAPSPASNHRPLHLSVELTRGWTDRFETAVFVQTAPVGSNGSARFAGGHVRGKYQIGETPRIPIGMAVSAEYAFNRLAFDGELQTMEIRSIVDYRQGRLWLVANPSFEMVTKSSEESLEPMFDLSAGAGWQLTTRLAVTTDYFSRAATTRHLIPEIDAHHLVFGGVHADVDARWQLSLGLGHCVTSSEPWLIKSVVGYRF
jgi:hypothetical protein